MRLSCGVFDRDDCLVIGLSYPAIKSMFEGITGFDLASKSNREENENEDSNIDWYISGG